MVRFIVAVIITVGLAACQTEDPQVSLASQNVNDTRIAKTLFGAAPVASAQQPEAIGGYARGCQAGGVDLPDTGSHAVGSLCAAMR